MFFDPTVRHAIGVEQAGRDATGRQLYRGFCSCGQQSEPSTNPITARRTTTHDKGVNPVITSEELIDLLTEAALIGRNVEAVQQAKTRGDVTAIIEQWMRKSLARIGYGSPDTWT